MKLSQLIRNWLLWCGLRKPAMVEMPLKRLEVEGREHVGCEKSVRKGALRGD